MKLETMIKRGYLDKQEPEEVHLSKHEVATLREKG